MQHIQQLTAPINSSNRGMKPLKILSSLLIFGTFTLLIFLSFHLGIPALENMGLTSFEAFIVANTVPMAVMFAIAIGAVTAEQSVTTFAEFRQVLRERMRFPRLTPKAILQGIGVYAILLVVGVVATVAGRLLIEVQLIPLPENLPLILDPQAQINAETLTSFVGGQLIGNWGIILLFGIQIFFNIAGEELFWRGYILPRQELAFGNRTWIVHGLMWWTMHLFKWWDLVTVLPLTLIISYTAQRTKNNWVPTIAHLLANTLLILLMLAGVLGLMS